MGGKAGLFIGVCAAFIAGCGAPAPAEDTARVAQPIVGGSASSAADDAVVLLKVTLPSGTFGCTGTLIAPNLVLTALHCVADYGGGDQGCALTGTPGAGSQITVQAQPGNIEVFTHEPPVSSGRGGQLIIPPEKETCLHDIALLVLQQPIAGATVAPIRIDGPPVVGEPVSVVGYGKSEVSASTPAPRRRRDGLSILDLGPGTLPLQIPEAIPDNHTAIGEGVCFGDSGGPLLAASGAVLGVSAKLRSDAIAATGSTAEANCVQTAQNQVFALHTRVDRFRDLFVQGFVAAGARPWQEGESGPPTDPPGPAGATCGDAWDCASALCDPGSAQCVDPCAADGTCPAGTTCGPLGAQTACLPPSTANSSGGAGDGGPGTSPAGDSGGCALSPTPARGGVAWLGLLLAAALLGRRSARRIDDNLG